MSETGKSKRTKLIEKVRALLAMTTDRGASEAEAMNAAAMASKLMEEHDLAYEDIEAELKGERYGARARKFSDTPKLHESHLCAEPIGRYWDCKTWFGQNPLGEVQLIFFGSADDTNLAHDMMTMIRGAINKSWQEYKVGNAADYAKLGAEMRAAFMEGMTVSIICRLLDLKAARTGKGDTSRALVVAKDAIVTEKFNIFAEQNGMKIEEQKAGGQEREVDAMAYFAGMMAGDRVKLVDEVEKQ